MRRKPAHSDIPRWWTRQWQRFDRHELRGLFVGLGACVLLFGFVSLAGEVMEGDTQAFDTKILQSLRDSTDPSQPIGPAWMEGALLDLTAVGGTTVLGLMLVAVTGFLLLQTRHSTTFVVFIPPLRDDVPNAAMEHAFNRTRPHLVQHLPV